MKITIIYDNTVFRDGLKSDWGFSALIEFNNRKILFDTGGNGAILLENMRKLNINPKSIDTIFISHNHFDHVGGLSEFLNKNNDVKLYAPSTFRGVKNVRELEYIVAAKEISENIYTTGELDRIEQSLIIKTEKGLIIIVGCAHPEIEQILNVAKRYGEPYALIGGFHGFNKLQILTELCFLTPTHCSENTEKIKSLYPEKYISGGAGKVIEFE